MDYLRSRPKTRNPYGSPVSTPRAAEMVNLLGGASSGAVTLTSDEKRAIDRLYGFVPEQPRQRPERPVEPRREDFADWASHDAAVRAHKAALEAWQKWTDPRQFMQAGANRNVFRHAKADGLRMLAWIARHMQPGDDPVKALVRLAVDAGWDVDPADVDWCNEGEV
jgi:hypothetical protein